MAYLTSTAVLAFALVALSFSSVRADHLSNLTDADIANFALNLEYLEAQFYLYASNGDGLMPDQSGGGMAVGGKKAKLSPRIAAYASEIAADELAHVLLLRGVLGAGAVASPKIDIGRAFSALASAALGKTVTFDPYESDLNFLIAAYVFEDVGVTAYKGAAPLIADKGILAAAAGLLGTEAYHAGAIRTLLLGYQKEKIFGVSVAKFVNAISTLRATADGTNGTPGNDDQGITYKNMPNIVPADANALVFARSPAQVLSIVYLGGMGMGGFFPDGLNGLIK